MLMKKSGHYSSQLNCCGGKGPICLVNLSWSLIIEIWQFCPVSQRAVRYAWAQVLLCSVYLSWQICFFLAKDPVPKKYFNHFHLNIYPHPNQGGGLMGGPWGPSSTTKIHHQKKKLWRTSEVIPAPFIAVSVVPRRNTWNKNI